MRDRAQRAAIVLTALAGFSAGTALPELFRMGTGSYAGFLSLYGLQKYGTGAVSAARLLPYIASGRMRTLLFLWMSSYTAAGFLFHLLYVGWLAVSAGMLASLFALRGGYQGILLLFCCLFPQWLLYGTMWYREAEFLFRKQRIAGYLSPNSAENPVRARFRGIGRKAGRRAYRPVYAGDLAALGGMIGLCLLGCCAEAFLGMWTLRIFLQYHM